MPAVVLLAGAEADSLEIFMRLEARNPDAADGFFRRRDECPGQFGLHPEYATAFEGKFRRLIMRGFPFGIFFTVEAERLFVQAILDLRQNPEHIRRRLGLE